MDITRSLKTVVSTGKVVFGLDQTKKAIKEGKAKLVLRASNCPERDFSGASVHEFKGTNAELGAACGKPFSISVMAILEAGESDILSLK